MPPRRLPSPRLRGARRTTVLALREGDPLDRRTKDGKARAARREFMDETRTKFELWSDATENQKQRELDDLGFYADIQWPADVKLARAGRNAQNGLPPIPARPCIVVNKLREPVNQVLNEARDAELGIELTPADDFEGLGVVLDDTEITLREGLIRRIQRDSQASNMRIWAALRALIAGQGYYGIMTRFSKGTITGPASAAMFDKELFVTGWYNQSCVTLDPTHEQPDGSDAEGGFIGRWITWEDYKLAYPTADEKRNLISSLSDDDFVALGEDAPKWFKSTGKQRSVHVVDFFYTVKTPRTLCQLEDGSAEWKDELPTGAKSVDEIDIIDITVKWAVLDGVNPEPLEETDWITPDIPIIKIVGEELQPFDDERRVEGLVRPGRGAQEGFNAMASTVVEMVAQTPKPNVYVANGQMEGFEKWWELSTTHNLPAVPYNFKDAEGQPVGPPVVVNKQSPIEAVSMALGMFDQAVQTTTRSHDPLLGKVDPSLRGNARAYDKVIGQSKEGTSNFLDNYRRSLRREAEMLNNALYPVYGTRPGRIAKIVNGKGEPDTVMLGVPYTMAGKRPKPVLVPHPDDPNQMTHAPMDHQPLPPHAQKFQLSEHANCNIAISIKRSADTRRQEEFDMLSTIVEADPSQLAIVGDLLWKNADSPGHEELEERYRVMLAPPIQAMIAAKKAGQPYDPAAQAQLSQAKQLLEKANQEIQQLTQEKQGKVVEQQGKAAITQTQEQHEDARAALDREVKLAVAEIQAQTKQALQDMALFYEERSRIGAHIHEQAMGGKEQASNIALAHHAAISDAALSAQEHAQALAQGSQEHQQTLEQGQQAAALAPEPTPTNPAGA